MRQQSSAAVNPGERDDKHEAALRRFCAAYEACEQASLGGKRLSVRKVLQLRKLAAQEGITLDDFLRIRFFPHGEFRLIESGQQSYGDDEDPDAQEIRAVFEEHAHVEVLGEKDGRLYRTTFVPSGNIIQLHDDPREDDELIDVDLTLLHVRGRNGVNRGRSIPRDQDTGRFVPRKKTVVSSTAH